MTSETPTNNPPLPRIAVIGAGYWGKNLIRNFHALHALHTICDSREEQRQSFKQQYPEFKKGSGPFCAQHPSGRSGKRVLTPF